MNYSKVKDFPELIKDNNTHAVLVHGKNGRDMLNAHFLKKQQFINTNNELNNLKNEIKELKNLINMLLDKEK